ncbi:MAG TPA: FMN-binding negative transcriptional regulator, partial [Flavipsychrobacter sp.]|nr:FMN-binding negative transcriptional regulator [Flavipsychrobacter sp.]
LAFMYKMPEFTETDSAEILAFMKAHPFVTLIASANSRPVATQVPVLIEERDGKVLLRAHIMRKTDHHLAIEQNPDVLILFQGAHCYVSSSWYTEKMGATWNYQTVHARGTVKWLDEAGTVNAVRDLMNKYESGQEKPLFVEHLPDGYVAHMVKAIVGFEMEVTDTFAIFKLSQNRDDESYKNIVKHLQATNDTDAHKVANELMRRRPTLFNT